MSSNKFLSGKPRSSQDLFEEAASLSRHVGCVAPVAEVVLVYFKFLATTALRLLSESGQMFFSNHHNL
jgi:hypothetical protein